MSDLCSSQQADSNAVRARSGLETAPSNAIDQKPTCKVPVIEALRGAVLTDAVERTASPSNDCRVSVHLARYNTKGWCHS